MTDVRSLVDVGFYGKADPPQHLAHDEALTAASKMARSPCKVMDATRLVKGGTPTPYHLQDLFWALRPDELEPVW